MQDVRGNSLIRTNGCQGFTLVETMVAMGLAGGLILAIANMTQVANKSGKAVAQTGDWTDVLNIVNGALLNKDVCTATFARHASLDNTNMHTGNWSANLPNGLVRDNGSGAITDTLIPAPSATTNTRNTLQFTTLSVDAYEVTGTAGLFNATLHVGAKTIDSTATTAGTSGLGNKVYSRDFPFIIITAQDYHTVLGCFAVNNDEVLCNSLGLKYYAGRAPPCTQGWSVTGGSTIVYALTTYATGTTGMTATVAIKTTPTPSVTPSYGLEVNGTVTVQSLILDPRPTPSANWNPATPKPGQMWMRP